jgi:hypothetical protein
VDRAGTGFDLLALAQCLKRGCGNVVEAVAVEVGAGQAEPESLPADAGLLRIRIDLVLDPRSVLRPRRRRRDVEAGCRSADDRDSARRRQSRDRSSRSTDREIVEAIPIEVARRQRVADELFGLRDAEQVQPGDELRTPRT